MRASLRTRSFSVTGRNSRFRPYPGLHESWLEQTTREVEPVSDILSVCI
jgi:hypothetical protein